MGERKRLVIGLLGLGTVGSGVYELIRNQREELRQKYGVELEIKRVVVRSLDKPRMVEVEPGVLSTDPWSILNDGEINTVIEVIGGVEPARRYVLEALGRGKHVITANKALLAVKGRQVFRQALRKGVYLGFRAAVTGFQDIIDRVSSSISITRLAGVFNGTCNYILTQMEKTEEDFATVLRQAQELGYAEDDPSLDIDGWDTTDKLAVLCMLAFNCYVRRQDIFTEGIRHIRLDDLRFARELGYRIKLLGIASTDDGKLEARVHPCLVPQDNMLARLEGVENGIQVDDSLRGKGGFTAPGAGKYPTACAVMFDLINIACGNPNYFPREFRKLRIKKMAELESEYYLRVNAINRPGVLEKIAGVFRRHDINIMSVLQQKGASRERGQVVPLVIIVDKASERAIQRAVRQIQRLEVIQGEVSLIRVLESLW